MKHRLANHDDAEAIRTIYNREVLGSTVTFDQPGSRANTLGQPVLTEWESLLGQLESRNDLRGLILRSGKPGMFIAGADLKELGAAKPESDLARKLIQRGHNLIAAFENLPYPTVAAIDGVHDTVLELDLGAQILDLQ